MNLTTAQAIAVKDTDAIRALGYSDPQIAAMDAADFAAQAAVAPNAYERRRLLGSAARAAQRAGGLTLADLPEPGALEAEVEPEEEPDQRYGYDEPPRRMTAEDWEAADALHSDWERIEGI